MLVSVRIGSYSFSYEMCSVTAHNICIWKYNNVNSVIRDQFQKTRTTLKQNKNSSDLNARKHNIRTPYVHLFTFYMFRPLHLTIIKQKT